LYLGPQRQPFSISLFHQLRSLDVIRRDVTEMLPQEETQLCRHCQLHEVDGALPHGSRGGSRTGTGPRSRDSR
ncbi:hypothetical protein EI94DRAFT_1632208, partial [Lactarius quietus]